MARFFILAAAGLVALTLNLALLGPHSARASGVQGDANCNISVGVDDALAILNQSAGLTPSASCIYNGDANCDGHYTADDVLRVLAYLAGAPLPPIPGCLPVGSPYQTTPSPTPVISPPPGPTFTPTPVPSIIPTSTPPPTSPASVTPTPTIPPPTHTPAPNQTPRTSGDPTCQVFPSDNPWNTDISHAALDANSNNYVDFIGRYTHLHPDFGTVWSNAPIGIPYTIVGGNQPQVPISFYYDTESDPGPYPIPPDVPIEGQPVGQPNTSSFGGDRHVLVVDETACKLYEVYNAQPINGGQSWIGGSGAVFDLNSNALRPDTWTSADAAGLPIFAGLVRYSEVVEDGVINHALRFTVSDTQAAFIHPATHEASSDTNTNAPPMGLRFRMKASYDCSWASTEVQVICTALKKYGMIVADNGSNWYVSGAPDSRWSDDHLGDLKSITGDAFEVVNTGEPIRHNTN
ncbi:MAG TPA: hypothetical protein VIP09_10335 [Dehalococcoidia bacterium]|jgi:hypothetical protein